MGALWSMRGTSIATSACDDTIGPAWPQRTTRRHLPPATCHLARYIDKIRLQQQSLLPAAYAAVLGHRLGVDGAFVKHFSLTHEHMTSAVATHGSDTDMAAWFDATIEAASKSVWNELAPNLGRQGYPMHRVWRIARRTIYQGQAAGFDTVFEALDWDEGRSAAASNDKETRQCE